ncbi:hypothetical protein [Methylobacterium sp. WL6]|uniref:hypothetical protein n=1 Tax=Methylobacterium sp. WL6 TaxID=2603901 RepID=UPI0011CA1FC2|nr:hypothetical protein [Methylobacterium sp. WL6]TXN71620.1 hypothetical protein FV230_07680 [Methylobacterium sp. WL6]
MSMEPGGLNFLATSLALAAEYRDAGISPDDAERLGRGHALIAKVENATSIDELRGVMRDLVRDLYRLGHPVPPWSKPEPDPPAELSPHQPAPPVFGR